MVFLTYNLKNVTDTTSGYLLSIMIHSWMIDRCGVGNIEIVSEANLSTATYKFLNDEDAMLINLLGSPIYLERFIENLESYYSPAL